MKDGIVHANGSLMLDPVLVPHVAAVRTAAVHALGRRDRDGRVDAMTLRTHVARVRTDLARGLRLTHLPTPQDCFAEEATIHEQFTHALTFLARCDRERRSLLPFADSRRWTFTTVTA